MKAKSPSVMLIAATLIALLVISCSYYAPAGAPTSTPDYPALETQVWAALRATLTAKAPSASPTPEGTQVTPSAPQPTQTPTPYATLGPGPLFAYVRMAEDQTQNVVLRDESTESESVLTHFVEPLNMTDLTWTRDGEWLFLASGHDYLSSRDNERNLFIMRPDGTNLRMLTGDYVDPDEAPGPFVTLKGQVMGADGPCVVCAQGAPSPASTDDQGQFELAGVPVTSRWARAVCIEGSLARQGDIDLALSESDTPAVTIQVEPRGQGWTQASAAPDGCRLAGLYYEWTLDDNDSQQYRSRGLIMDVQGVVLGEFSLPEGAVLSGLDWSPTEDVIVGAVTAEQGTALWRWDSQGQALDPLVEIPNPAEEILTARNPVWSPDAAHVVFEVQHRYWWGDPLFKTELMLYTIETEELKTLVAGDWGQHVYNPAWTADGNWIQYESAVGEPGEDSAYRLDAHLWSIPVTGEGSPVGVVVDVVSMFPAPRPAPLTTPRSDETPMALPCLTITP